MITILPTNGVVDDAYRLAQSLSTHDYDMEEYVRACLDALCHRHSYPDSLTGVLALFSNFNHHDDNDREVYSQLISLIYHTLYRAMCVANIYDDKGEHRWRIFDIYHGDIAVSNDIDDLT